MKVRDSSIAFTATLLQPAARKPGESWCFLVLPKTVSDQMPRRGRTSVHGTVNGIAFQATLEPDGQLSHWLKLDKALCKTAGAKVGESVAVELAPLKPEPEPRIPAGFQAALDRSPDALSTWHATTTLARVDWIHWIESAKQASTRDKRIRDALSMLASGKRRVCCFDHSGYYAKSLCAPEAETD